MPLKKTVLTSAILLASLSLFVTGVFAEEPPAPALKLRKFRVPLVTIKIRNYAPYEKVRSSLDVAVEETRTGDGILTACRLVPPENKSATQEQWAPFHFYSNIISEEEKASKIKDGEVGVPDVFFKGDESNRNGLAGTDKESHSSWTRAVDSKYGKCFKFSERVPEKIDSKTVFDKFTFLVGFTRGSLKWQRLVQVRTYMFENRCETKAFFCAREKKDQDGKTVCIDDEWDRWVDAIFADVTYYGFLTTVGEKDETLKKDLSSLEARVTKLEVSGANRGRPYGRPEAEMMCSQ